MSVPNQLTVLRMALAPFIVLLTMVNTSTSLQFALGLFIIAAVTDWCDGQFARKYGYVSKWGKLLDPVADKILVSSSFLTFYVLSYVKLWMVMVIIIRDFIVMGLRIFTFHNNKQMNTTGIAKVKTFAQMTLLGIIFVYMNLEKSVSMKISGYIKAHVLTFEDIIHKATLIVTIFTAFTGAFYLIDNRHIVKDIIWRFYKVFIPSDL